MMGDESDRITLPMDMKKLSSGQPAVEGRIPSTQDNIWRQSWSIPERGPRAQHVLS